MTLNEIRKLSRNQLDGERANCFRGSIRDGMVAAECERRDRKWNRLIAALGLGIGVVAAFGPWLR